MTKGDQFGSWSSHEGNDSRRCGTRPRQVVKIQFVGGLALGPEFMGEYKALYPERAGETTPDISTGISLAKNGHCCPNNRGPSGDVSRNDGERRDVAAHEGSGARLAWERSELSGHHFPHGICQ